MNTSVLQGYADAAAELIPRFNAISPARLYAPVQHLLPKPPARILDIGAGTGRDAAWFAAAGHSVLAVEPVAPLRAAGQAQHSAPSIEWCTDTLPRLARVTARGEQFDLIVLTAVWQHLEDTARQQALPVLRRLARAGGSVLMSLRHGPGTPERQVWPCTATDLFDQARQAGFAKLCDIPADSLQPRNQQAGVRWTWAGLTALP